MTATGFTNTKLLPDNSVISNVYIAQVVAGFMQSGILAFYLSIPYFTWRAIVFCVLSSVFACSLIILSALFALFSITYTSQGENLFAYRTSTLNSISARIEHLNNSLSNTFENYIRQLHKLAQDACMGNDETGIAKCGSIAKGYIKKAKNLSEIYQPQLVEATHREPNSSDFMGILTSLVRDYAALSQKMSAYKNFAGESNISSTAFEMEHRNIGKDIEELRYSLSEAAPDTKTLVLQRVLGDAKDSIVGTARPIVYFSITISFLPDIISVTLTSILLVVRVRKTNQITFRRAIRQAADEEKFLNEYADAINKRRSAKQRYRDERWMDKVETHVDDVLQ